MASRGFKPKLPESSSPLHHKLKSSGSLAKACWVLHITPSVERLNLHAQQVLHGTVVKANQVFFLTKGLSELGGQGERKMVPVDGGRSPLRSFTM